MCVHCTALQRDGHSTRGNAVVARRDEGTYLVHQGAVVHVHRPRQRSVAVAGAVVDFRAAFQEGLYVGRSGGGGVSGGECGGLARKRLVEGLARGS